MKDLQPSFAYLYKTDNGLKNTVCEVLKEKMPRYAIRGRVKKYREYFENNTNKESVDMVFICPNEQVLDYLEDHIEKLIGEEEYFDAQVYLATQDQIKKIGMDISVFKKGG